MIIFSSKEVDLGIVEAGSKQNFEFKYQGEKENIVHVQPGCSCTADIEITKDAIKGIYTDNVGLPIINSMHIDSLKKIYPNGTIKVSKDLTVFFKDEQDTYIIEGMIKKLNPNKRHLVLKINMLVKLW